MTLKVVLFFVLACSMTALPLLHPTKVPLLFKRGGCMSTDSTLENGIPRNIEDDCESTNSVLTCNIEVRKKLCENSWKMVEILCEREEEEFVKIETMRALPPLGLACKPGTLATGSF
jgi:hypothetical protein